MPFPFTKTPWLSAPCLLIAAMPLTGHATAASLAPLHVENGRILDDRSKPVTLKGANLGNWLILEMWMLAIDEPGVTDQFELERTLARRFGEPERQRLMEVYRENYMTARDFEILRSFGMNLVRLPFSYELMESDDQPLTLKPDAWKWLDQALALAESHGFYVILDLHGAPGRQSAMDHVGRRDFNQLWTDPRAQERTRWLWKEMAARYRGRASVAAYDLMNEPWGGTEEQLRDLMAVLYDDVRSVDPDHIVVLPGHYSGIDFYGDPAAKGWTNVIFTMHFYPGFFGWGRPDPYVHRDFLEGGLLEWKARMDRLRTPLFIGEFNVVSRKAGGGEMMRRYFDFYAAQGWPTTMWSYKVFTREGGMKDGSWGMVSNAEPLPAIRFSEAGADEIENWFRSFSTMPYAVNEDLRHWMTTRDSPSSLADLPPPPPLRTVAPRQDPLPDGWQVSDIGNARAGGQEVLPSGTWVLYGGGDDIWRTNDSFRFTWREVSGPFAISAAVLSLEDTHPYAKAGLMVRESLQPGSPHVLISAHPSGGLELAIRPAPDAPTHTEWLGSEVFPDVRLRIERSGRNLELTYGTQVRHVELPFEGDSLYAGLAVLSHDNQQLTRAEFQDVNLKRATREIEAP